MSDALQAVSAVSAMVNSLLMLIQVNTALEGRLDLFEARGQQFDLLM